MPSLAEQVPPNSREVSATTLAIIGAHEATWDGQPALSEPLRPDPFPIVSGGLLLAEAGWAMILRRDLDFDVESNSTKYLFFRTSVKDPNREATAARAAKAPPAIAYLKPPRRAAIEAREKNNAYRPLSQQPREPSRAFLRFSARSPSTLRGG